MIKVVEAFAGIGSQRMALRNLGVEHEVVGIFEIDKYAIKSYEAIHGPVNNLGDISKVNIEDIPDHDLFTYSFPCQDLSVAGKQQGLIKGQTRSGLLYECEKVIESKRPKYLLLENVKNLVGKKFKGEFDKWLEYLESLGYTNYWRVLNAKDYGVPQNRERVFVVSILGEHKPYKFPSPIKLDKVIKDILEDEVEEKYYMNKPFELVNKGNIKAEFTNINFEQTKRIYGTDSYFQTLAAKDRGCNNILIEAKLTDYSYKQVNQILNKDGICVTLDTMQGGHREPKILCVGNINPSQRGMNGNVFNQDGISPTLTTNKGEGNKILEYKGQNIELPCICASRERNPMNPSSRISGEPTEQRIEINIKGTSNTITTVQKDNYAIEENFRVRKLTPLECWRLMSFSDEDFYKAKNAGISNTQLYKQAGNSIVVKVLEGVFKQLFL